MGGAEILCEEEEEKALLTETHKNFNQFIGQEEEAYDHHNSAADSDNTNNIIVSQLLGGGGGDDDDESSLQHHSIERTLFWESQEALLQEILDQYSSSGSKLREEIKKHIEIARETNFCDCAGPKLDGCTNCLRGRIVNLLTAKGFHASLCTSTWKRTQKIPGGSHEYIEVIARSQGKKRKIIFLIEIEFKDEFKMAKACDEHKKLIGILPETYIGKPEHLNAIVRVMCDAAKRSAAEKKIHMGPWRKKSFMQMKWSASHENQRKIASSEQNDIDQVLQFTPYTAVRVA